MKKLILAIVAVFSFMAVSAQITDSYATRKRLDTVLLYDLREKLVDLAMQHPENGMVDAQISMAENSLKKAKGSWLNMFFASGNLNEFTLDPNNPAAAFWPKYNFGVNMPMDIFSRTSNDIKSARHQVEYYQAMKGDTYRKLRAEVLEKFEDYLFHRELYEMSLVATDEAYAAYLSMQEKYKVGDVNDIDYSLTFRQYNDLKMKQRQYERDMRVSKLQVEKLIGKDLNEVIKDYNLKR